MSRIVVIGGGLGGTASAARLAKLGHQVTVVEQLPQLGGAVGTIEQDGFRWATGPTYTALPAVLRDLFRKSGRALEKEINLVPVNPLREHRFADGTRLALPSGSRGAQLEAVSTALGERAGREWVEYVGSQAATWDLLRRDFLERPYSPEHAPRETTDLLRRRRMLHQSVTRAFKDKRLRTLAWHHATQGGHDPRNTPAWLGVVDYLEQNFGTWTIPAEAGGFGALADLLSRRLGVRGVSVLTSTTVLDVEMGPTGPVAVRTDQGTVDADLVVVAIDPRHVPALARFVARTMPAIPPTVTHLGLTGAVPDLLPELVIHDDAVLTVRTDGSAPDGAAAWTISGRGKLAEDLVSALARKRIDVRDAIVTQVDRSPRELVQHYSGSPAGVLWQGRATVRHRLSTVTPLPGVYAAGAHTGGGSLVPFVGLSAALVAQEIGPA